MCNILRFLKNIKAIREKFTKKLRRKRTKFEVKLPEMGQMPSGMGEDTRDQKIKDRFSCGHIYCGMKAGLFP